MRKAAAAAQAAARRAVFCLVMGVGTEGERFFSAMNDLMPGLPSSSLTAPAQSRGSQRAGQRCKDNLLIARRR
jgi:hypothetical protein